MNKLFWLFFLFMVPGCWQTAQAQYSLIYPVQYRPPNQNWQQLRIPHFKIIFPAGLDSVAYKTAHILESQYPEIQELTGGGLSNFPIILNGYTDIANGFVTPFDFRSEIVLSPSKGKTENPVNGGWLQNVLPHELTHALQFSHFGGFGLGSLIRIFSPDLARSMHAAPPSGIQEGLAVYHESHGVVPRGGRGNYPYFTNIFKATFLSPHRWSMGQMVQPPAYTRPFGRYYIGGYEFTHWLQQTYGPKTTRDAIDFHIRWPFLGYGVALKHATSRWPGHLYDQFVKTKKKELYQEYHNADYRTYAPLPLSFPGASIRRPKWLSDSTLIFYGSFYNAKPGFYRYNLTDHSMKRIITTGSVSGYNYTLSGDKNQVIFSFYKPDLIYPNAYKTTLARASINKGGFQSIKTDAHLYNPVSITDSTLYALQVYHTTSKLVKVNLATHKIQPIYKSRSNQLISIAVKPTNADSLAVIINKDGDQALWIASTRHLKKDLTGPPAVSFADGSVFDPVWRPDGQALLFSADFSGILQIYEYNLGSGLITQLTNAPFNAFEASYSTNGNRIAFIIQKGNEKLPVVLKRNDFYGKTISENIGKIIRKGLNVSSISKDSWKVTPYKTGISWLKPRTVAPVVKDISGSDRYRLGVGIYSSDLLAEQAYSLEGTFTKGRFWYDADYRNKQFFPGFKLRVYSKPGFRLFKFKPQKGKAFVQKFLRQERRFSLSIPMHFTFKQNVASTGLYVQPELSLSQLRYFTFDGSHPSNFANSMSADLFVQFNYRLQQDIRSVQPNSGLILYSEIEQYLSSNKLHLHTRQGTTALQLTQPTAFRSGLYGYVSPLRRWNQSLRLGIETINQTGYTFETQSIVSNGFSDRVFPLSKNLLSFSGRYTIPLFYPDDGWLLIPLYLSSVYLVAFGNTVVAASKSASRTVFGGEIRIQFRISNLAIDIGLGIGYEPSRNETHFFVGSF